MADGLSEATVLAITQDDLGFIWFATQNGLDKYDGYHFTVYTHDPDNPASLSSNNTRFLYWGHDGTLWIGTFEWRPQSNGSNHRETFSHYSNLPDDPTSLSDNYVRAILEDSQGRLWVGTQNGLNRLTPRRESSPRYFHDPHDPTS